MGSPRTQATILSSKREGTFFHSLARSNCSQRVLKMELSLFDMIHPTTIVRPQTLLSSMLEKKKKCCARPADEIQVLSRPKKQNRTTSMQRRMSHVACRISHVQCTLEHSSVNYPYLCLGPTHLAQHLDSVERGSLSCHPTCNPVRKRLATRIIDGEEIARRSGRFRTLFKMPHHSLSAFLLATRSLGLQLADFPALSAYEPSRTSAAEAHYCVLR